VELSGSSAHLEVSETSQRPRRALKTPEVECLLTIFVLRLAWVACMTCNVERLLKGAW
jgi:hypothetical protein